MSLDASSANCSGRPLIVGPPQLDPPFPIFVEGSVVAGFGRGGKQLGIPTANLPEAVVEQALADIPIGVYYGWAKVNTGADCSVLPMVMSLGWNPFFKNEKRSGEVHIIHSFDNDFYDQHLQVAILAYIRPERDYASLEALVDDIHFDIRVALESLQRPAYAEIKAASFFQS
ncbi:riboflavin kinase [Coemansia thaxteri]|uniref:Riboflavin kinase n=1 Tax=Coemansia thaxteri TaxID=2663907 RepID=A0A9W8BM72_9FUNG|nr:riboflavin kinase [Coemansia thaxteri]KAJ2486575.1 riboflavin kinase [Coemansia sp. RSA 2320]